ncbi:hypothetical protein AD933_00855, partial [Acetobacter malorum]
FFECEGTLPQFHTHAAQAHEIATFFYSIAAFLRRKNQSRSFFLIAGLLHLRCALMTGVTVSFFRTGGF